MADEPGATEPDPTPLAAPADGVPEVAISDWQIADAAELLASGRGAFAVDAERASGFRYSNRAYLIQIRRAGAGTVLIDPVNHGGDPVQMLAPLAEVLGSDQWILHAADQDLPCLAEVGLRPPSLYDTELAGRLAGFERVNLATMVARLLGLGLAKGHGAADWSKRPLPPAWLNYAALDVEVLVELRDAIAEVLHEQGKTDWAAEEFEHLRTAEPAPPRRERWRRTSGIHKVRNRRALAEVREMWTVRDRIAARRDIAPGRILPDSAIIEAALTDPKTVAELTKLPVPAVIAALAAEHKLVVSCEDNGVAGGIGSAVSAALRAAEVDVPCRDIGVAQRFLPHASRGQLLEEMGLTDRDIARRITGWIAAQHSPETNAEVVEKK